LKRYEFRFCALAVPDDWVPVPPLGLAEPRQREGRLSLRVAEEWLRVPVAAADYARRQKELLAGALAEFELIREGPFPDARSGYALIFEYENEERLTSREMRIYRAQGLHVVILNLLGNGGEDRIRDQVFDAIARSFERRGDEPFERAERRPLLGALEGGALLASDPGAVREGFPRACVSLAVPRGWEARREEGSAVLHRSGVEIRLRRVLEHENYAGIWFERRMKRLRDSPGSQMSAWSDGTLTGGPPFVAVLYDETARGRSWNTAAAQRTLDVAVADRQLLEWSLRAPAGSSFHDQQAVLQSVIASAVFLDPAEWETCPLEPWIDLTLRGPWDVHGPGTYVHSQHADLLLQLGCVESHTSLEALRPRLLESLRRACKVQRSSTQMESLGLLRGLSALRWSGQGRMAVRAIWLRSEESLYSCVLQGRDGERLDELFLEAIEGMRLPGMRSAA
jgi:hypothetical protein